VHSRPAMSLNEAPSGLFKVRRMWQTESKYAARMPMTPIRGRPWTFLNQSSS
jgi:hypothetical protein